MKILSLFGNAFLISCLASFLGNDTRLCAFESPRVPEAKALSVGGVPDDAPIAIEARATATNLIIEMALEPEWHVYCRDVGGGQPVALTLDSDSGVVATGELEIPSTPSGKLDGTIQINLPIGLGKGAASRQLGGTLRLQVCDALMCLPPMEVNIEGEIPSLSVLLVVGESDDRSKRIEDWLGSRGFQTSVKTYADVDASDCDSHDVVLADSNVFGKTTASRAVVQGFPESETPLVAVGFNGTELIESHEIAMTSGYI